MKRPISIVIPSLADTELLGSALTCLQDQVNQRGVGDEVLVVDDTGQGALEPFMVSEFPAVTLLRNLTNLGFAQAAMAGARTARNQEIFLMNPDVILRPGCLDFLQEALLANSDVFAVAPYILLNGDEATAESLPSISFDEGQVLIERKGLSVTAGEPLAQFPHGIPVAFALGGACMMRRAEFLENPFDPRFEPFYWEDVDLGQSMIAQGRQVLVDPRAVAEHHHRGTIGVHAPQELVRAAIEKNRHLFAWKHLRGERLAQNIRTLAARTVEHSLVEDREQLIWLALALEQDEAL